MVLLAVIIHDLLTIRWDWIAISEGHGDTALVLLKAGAETDKQDMDGDLAIDLAPDTKARYHHADFWLKRGNTNLV